MKKKLLFLVLGLALTLAVSFPPSTIASTCTDNCYHAFQNRNNACSFLEFDERTACMQSSWEMYQECLADC